MSAPEAPSVQCRGALWVGVRAENKAPKLIFSHSWLPTVTLMSGESVCSRNNWRALCWFSSLPEVPRMHLFCCFCLPVTGCSGRSSPRTSQHRTCQICAVCAYLGRGAAHRNHFFQVSVCLWRRETGLCGLGGDAVVVRCSLKSSITQTPFSTSF